MLTNSVISSIGYQQSYKLAICLISSCLDWVDEKEEYGFKECRQKICLQRDKGRVFGVYQGRAETWVWGVKNQLVKKILRVF